jgi:hypothetical protein
MPRRIQEANHPKQQMLVSLGLPFDSTVVGENCRGGRREGGKEGVAGGRKMKEREGGGWGREGRDGPNEREG